MLGRPSIDVAVLIIKIFQTPKCQFVPLSKATNVKIFSDPGDLENKVKVKLLHAIKGLVILHLSYKYQVSIPNFS